MSSNVYHLDAYRKPKDSLPALDEKMYTLLMDRLGDLSRLVEIRGGKMDRQKKRSFLFIYGSIAMQTEGIDKGLDMAEGMNRVVFKKPLPEHEVAYILGDLAGMAESGDMYKYKTETIIGKLGIRYEEQEDMNVLRVPNLEIRLQAQKWHRTSWKEKKEILLEAEKNHPYATRDQLAQEIGVSPTTLSKWYGNLDKEKAGKKIW